MGIFGANLSVFDSLRHAISSFYCVLSTEAFSVRVLVSCLQPILLILMALGRDAESGLGLLGFLGIC